MLSLGAPARDDGSAREWLSPARRRRHVESLISSRASAFTSTATADPLSGQLESDAQQCGPRIPTVSVSGSGFLPASPAGTPPGSVALERRRIRASGRSPVRNRPGTATTPGSTTQEATRLRRQLAERDAVVAQQAAQLTDFEVRLEELRAVHAHRVQLLEKRLQAEESAAAEARPHVVRAEAAEADCAALRERLRVVESHAKTAERERDEALREADSARNQARQQAEAAFRDLLGKQRSESDSLRQRREEELQMRLAQSRDEAAALRAGVMDAEARAAALEAQVLSSRRQAEEAEAARHAALHQHEARAALLEQAESRITQLDRTTQEGRGLLTRQAGQLHAAQERIALYEAQIAELQVRTERAESEARRNGADALEGRAAVEHQAHLLQRTAEAHAEDEEALRTQQRRCGELEAELHASAAQLTAARGHLREESERACALETALASQATGLRQQLEADADAAAAQRLMRERAAWEASTLELDKELQTACQRRRRQARAAAGTLEPSVERHQRSRAYQRWLRWCSLRARDTAAGDRRRVAEEADACRRRELHLQEELDVAVRQMELPRKRWLYLRDGTAATLLRWSAVAVVAPRFRDWCGWLVRRAAAARLRDAISASATRSDARARESHAEAAERQRKLRGCTATSAAQTSLLRMLCRGFHHWLRWCLERRYASASRVHETLRLRRIRMGEQAVVVYAAQAGQTLMRCAFATLLRHSASARVRRQQQTRQHVERRREASADSLSVRTAKRAASLILLRWGHYALRQKDRRASQRHESDAQRANKRVRRRLGAAALEAATAGRATTLAAQSFARWRHWCERKGAAGVLSLRKRRCKAMMHAAAEVLAREVDARTAAHALTVWGCWLRERRREAAARSDEAAAADASAQAELRIAKATRHSESALQALADARLRSEAFGGWRRWAAHARGATAESRLSAGHNRQKRRLQTEAVSALGKERDGVVRRSYFDTWRRCCVEVQTERMVGRQGEERREAKLRTAREAIRQKVAADERWNLWQSFANWLRFAVLRHAAACADDVRNAAVDAAGVSSSAVQMADQVGARLRRARQLAANTCAGKVDEKAAVHAYSMWERWLCLRRIAHRDGEIRELDALRLEQGARIDELEQALETSAGEHAEVAARCEELEAESLGLRDHVGMLERGLAQARDDSAGQAAEFLQRTVDLEKERDFCMREMDDARAEVTRWRGEAETGVEAAQELFRSKVLVLTEEMREVKVAEENERQRGCALAEALEEQEARTVQAQRNLADAYSDAAEAQKRQRAAELRAKAEAENLHQQIAQLDTDVLAARGEIEELEGQVQGRAAEQGRLSAELGSVTTALAKEAQRRGTAERMLAESQHSYAARVTELADQVADLQNDLAAARGELSIARSRVVALEDESAKLRGRVKQVTRNRDILGPMSEVRKVSDAVAVHAQESALARELADAREIIATLERKLRAQEAGSQAAVVSAASRLGERDALQSSSRETELAAELAKAERRIAELTAQQEGASVARARRDLAAAAVRAEEAEERAQEAERLLDVSQSEVTTAGARAETRALAAEREVTHLRERLRIMSADLMLAKEREEEAKRSSLRLSSSESLHRQSTATKRLRSALSEATQERDALRAQIAATSARERAIEPPTVGAEVRLGTQAERIQEEVSAEIKDAGPIRLDSMSSGSAVPMVHSGDPIEEQPAAAEESPEHPAVAAEAVSEQAAVAAEASPEQPAEGSPEQTMSRPAAVKFRRVPFGKPASMPFKLKSARSSAQEPPVIVSSINTSELRVLRGELKKGDLVVEVKGPLGTLKVVTTADFHHAVSPAVNVTEESTVVLRVIHDSTPGGRTFIKKWSEQKQAELERISALPRGRRLKMPDVPPILVSEVELQCLPLDAESAGDLRAAVERRCAELGHEARAGVLYQLLYEPVRCEEHLDEAFRGTPGGAAAEAAPTLAKLAGCQPPHPELVAAALAGTGPEYLPRRAVRDAFLLSVLGDVVPPLEPVPVSLPPGLGSRRGSVDGDADSLARTNSARSRVSRSGR